VKQHPALLSNNLRRLNQDEGDAEEEEGAEEEGDAEEEAAEGFVFTGTIRPQTCDTMPINRFGTNFKDLMKTEFDFDYLHRFLRPRCS